MCEIGERRNDAGKLAASPIRDIGDIGRTRTRWITPGATRPAQSGRQTRRIQLPAHGFAQLRQQGA
ncbi:hypothetical protein, partial [Herbaspirillum frisingense]|uniref:hypothetical protein n=1 Tax=Herbaspirillum frisingense TaxID=92645 RepID=UPI0039AF67AD